MAQYNNWEEVYSENSFRNKNEYPSEDIISFMMRNYGSFDDRSKLNVLDLGCGWGNNLKFLNEKGFSCVGVDISKTAIQHCNSSGYDAKQCDFKKLPFDENFFDVVIDRQAIQHNAIEDIKKTICEVHRVLKQDGTFYTIIVSEAEYNIGTTCMNEKEIRDALSIFKIISVDRKTRTYDNQSVKVSLFIVHAQKK